LWEKGWDGVGYSVLARQEKGKRNRDAKLDLIAFAYGIVWRPSNP
jgi:hypothetical protein